MKPVYLVFEKLLKATSPDLQLEAVKGLTLIFTSGLSEDQQQAQCLVETLVAKALAVSSSDLRYVNPSPPIFVLLPGIKRY